MDEKIKQALAKFDLAGFRPGQERIISAVLAGQDVLGVLPTGGGKTLCYQLPALITGGLTVVVEPLLALMRDQVLRLQGLGVKRVVALNSTLDDETIAHVLMNLAQFNFLFIAPEMLQRSEIQRALRRVQVQLLVVDEAHCIDQWGADFRPAYLKLGEVRTAIAPRSVLALTATASANVQQVITQALRLREPEVVAESVDRPNLFIGVEQLLVAPEITARVQALVQQLAGDAVIYCPTKKMAEEMAVSITANSGRQAAFYHADLDANTRTLRERQFQSGAIEVMCATSAFGMGVDKPDVRLVVYVGVPQTLAEYFQAIGRAGRDGNFAVTALLYTPNDLQRAVQFAATLPEQALVDAVYKNPAVFANATDTQIQLIYSYARLGFAKKMVEQQLQARLQVRAAEIKRVTTFLNAPDCYRAALMAAFGSNARAHGDDCCGPIADDITTAAVPKQELPTPDFGWRNVFNKIFNNKC